MASDIASRMMRRIISSSTNHSMFAGRKQRLARRPQAQRQIDRTGAQPQYLLDEGDDHRLVGIVAAAYCTYASLLGIRKP